MFALHETTQRRVCRIAFIALCAIPTLITLGTVAYCNRPWRQTDWQRSLASRLHMRAELDDITRPRPGATVLTNLRLADLGLDSTLATIGKLRSQQHEGRLTFDADRVEIHAEQLDELAESFFTWLAVGDAQLLELHAKQLAIADETHKVVELADVHVRNETSVGGGQRFKIVGRMADDATIKLTIDSVAGQLRCTIDTRQAPLPAWLVGKLVPGLQGCGEASFAGMIVGQRDQKASSGTLQGTVQQIDLQEWVGADSLHRLQGLGQLEVTDLAWHNGRIKNLSGILSAREGALSRSLVQNAQQLCGGVVGPAWEPIVSREQDELLPFERLALRFQMGVAGIAVAGGCEGGALIVNDQRVALQLQHPEIMLPVGRIVRLLNHSQPAGWLPATREAHDMAERLPLPGDESQNRSGR